MFGMSILVVHSAIFFLSGFAGLSILPRRVLEWRWHPCGLYAAGTKIASLERHTASPEWAVATVIEMKKKAMHLAFILLETGFRRVKTRNESFR